MLSSKSLEVALTEISQDESKRLRLQKDNEMIGLEKFLPKHDASHAPRFKAPKNFMGEVNKYYIIVGLDPDAPFPSWSFLGPILHWIQPYVRIAGDGSLEYDESKCIVKYIAPNPPPGSSAHRYIFLLYEQPDSFNVQDFGPANGQKNSLFARVRWDLQAFEQKAKLQKILAGFFFLSK